MDLLIGYIIIYIKWFLYLFQFNYYLIKYYLFLYFKYSDEFYLEPTPRLAVGSGFESRVGNLT